MTRTLAGYRLGRRIAVGGMAEIFEAAAPDGARVVVKILLPQYARDPEIVRLLEHEGRLMQRIAHERLVQVIDVHASGEEPFLVLEHVDGAAADEVLERMKRRGERPTAAMALVMVLQLLDALGHVHGAALDVVHRDVSPHNVLLERSGDVKLGDFGIARSSLRDARTRTGIIRGKLRYLAPEQATGSAVDARTDLYALGLLFLEALTGEPYFSGENEVDLLRAAESPTFRKPSSIEGVDARFDRVIEKLLARFPEGRPRNAAAVKSDLEKIAGDLDLEAARAAWGREVTSIVPVERAMPAPPRSPWPLVALAVIAVTASVVGGYALFGRGPDVRPIVRSDAPAVIDAGAIEVAVAAPEIDAGAAPPSSDSGVRAPSRDAGRRGPGRPTPGPGALTPGPGVLTPGPGVEAPAPIDLEPLRARARALSSDLRSRGIVESDLSPAQRSELTALAAIDRDPDDAARRIDALSRELARITVDEPFVRAKLDRVDARIRSARARGMDTAEVEHLSALALQDLLEGRTDATNRRLNQIQALLDRQR